MKVGLYRYKISDLPVGTHVFPWYVNGEQVGASKVIVKPFCEDYQYLKYLNSKGEYRFFVFNSNWAQVDKGRKIGSANVLITSLSDAETDSENIGYTATRDLSLTAEVISDEELALFNDVYVSPRVYLRIGHEKYVQVELKGDGIGRRQKNKFGTVSVTIKLPTRYAITAL